MSTFKVGDVLRRTRHGQWSIGATATVMGIDDSWPLVSTENYTGPFRELTKDGWYSSNPGCWELVEETVVEKRFEVGKTYKIKNALGHHGDTVYTCVWVGEKRATVSWGDGQAYTTDQKDIKSYVEFKEPEIRSVWVNVYPPNAHYSDGQQDRYYFSKAHAEQCADPTRLIKCIELKYEV